MKAYTRLQLRGFCQQRSSSINHSPRIPQRSPNVLLAKPTSAFRTMTHSGATSPAGGEVSKTIFAVDQPTDLPDRVSKLSAWTISPSNKGLVRQFTFPTFSAAWRFMNLVAEESKAKRHHPSWHNLYNKVTIEWTTHKPEGLSIKDVEMAEICNQIAEKVGLQVQDHNTGTAGLNSTSSGSH